MIYTTTDTELTSVADAIRSKTGKSSSISFPNGFVSEIGSISGGSSDWEDITSSLTVGDYINVDYIKCYYNSNMNMGWLFAKNLMTDERPYGEPHGDLEIDSNFSPNWDALPNSLDFIITDAEEFYIITTISYDISDSGEGILIPGSYIPTSSEYSSTYTFGIWPI